MGNAGRPSRLSTGRRVAAGLVVLCAGAVGASFLLESRALGSARRTAVGDAVAMVDEVVAPLVRRDGSPASLTDAEEVAMEAALAPRVDPVGADRVRIWTPSGTLAFSTDPRDGAREPAPGGVRKAARAGGSVKDSLEPSDGLPSEQTLATFAPVRSGGDPVAVVVEVDRAYGSIVADASRTWATARTGAGGAGAVFLALALLSLAKRPRSRSSVSGFGAGGSGKTAAPSVDKELERKLAKSEEARSALEEQLDQLRTQMAGSVARSAAQEQAFNEGSAQAKEREKELERLLRDAEARAERSEREARFVAGADGTQTVEDGGGELERTRQELREAHARLDELEPMVNSSAARVQDAESRADRGARAADARAQEAVAKADESERQLTVALGRIDELERFVKDAEQKMAASADEAGRSTLRIRELEGKLEGARHDGQAMASRLEEAQAKAAEVSGASGGAVRRAEEAEARAYELEARIEELEAHTSQLEELARSAEERASAARFDADAASKATESLEAKVQQLSAATERPDEAIAGLERQLKEAHRAGKRAVRAASELRGELERTQADLERANLELDAVRLAAGEEAILAAGDVVPAPHAPESPSREPSATEQASPNGSDATSETDGQADPDEDGDQPSLRFRLARSAASRKGKVQEPTLS